MRSHVKVREGAVEGSEILEGTDGGGTGIVGGSGGRLREEGDQRYTRRYLGLLRQFARIELHLLLGDHEVEIIEKEEL